MDYWLHRISYCWDVSKPLFDKGYLTIGWNTYSYAYESLYEKAMYSSGDFDRYMKDVVHESGRSRWNLWYFGQMKVGDTVVVPLYEGQFAIAQIAETIRPIRELPIVSFKSLNNKNVVLGDNGLIYSDSPDDPIDLGFYIKITNVKPAIPRGYADSNLNSRMKMRQTNGIIQDANLIQSIEAARVAKAPANIHDLIVENTAEAIFKVINEKIDPDKFELLVKWYMEKMGASLAYRPAKNEAGKEDGADADVIAEFDPLGVVFYIQVKKHDGKTGRHAIDQIVNYTIQKGNSEDNITYIPWVITSADGYDEAAEKAVIDAAQLHKLYIRLIDRKMFAKMLVDAGISSINDVIAEIKSETIQRKTGLTHAN